MNFRSVRAWSGVVLLTMTFTGGALSTSLGAGASTPPVTRLLVLQAHASNADRRALLAQASRTGVTVLPSATPDAIIEVRGTEGAIAALSSNPVVQATGSNQRITLGALPTSLTRVQRRATTRPHTAASLCGTQAHPELDPEAVTAINAPAAWAAGATGAGAIWLIVGHLSSK